MDRQAFAMTASYDLNRADGKKFGRISKADRNGEEVREGWARDIVGVGSKWFGWVWFGSISLEEFVLSWTSRSVKEIESSDDGLMGLDGTGLI